jgi:hypothetical protein
VSDRKTSGRSPVEQPPSKAPGGRPAPPDDLAQEVAELAALLADVVTLAERRAMFPGRWEQIAELAMEFSSVRAALAAAGDAS